jgi:small subunit ribosomal protein S7
MPRRNRPAPKPVMPDPRYGSVTVQMFINRMMYDGKKSLAQRLFYNALDIVEERAKRPGVEVLEQALRNASPTVEIKPRRVGGSTYQVPVEVDPRRGATLAMRWILAASRSRGGRNMSEKLAAELMDALNNTGSAIKKKDETHKMAEANRAFAHYRW